jgi:CRP/FNR family transcriptional regulator
VTQTSRRGNGPSHQQPPANGAIPIEAEAKHEIADAIAASPLAHIPADALAPALSDTFTVNVPASVTIFRGDQSIGFSLVLRGLLRIYVVGDDGRQLTVQHARAGDLLGVSSLVGGPIGLHVQAITDARILRMPAAPMAALFHNDLRVAHVFSEELYRLLSGFTRELTLHALGTLRQRVIHQLVERAEPSAEGYVAGRVTQQQLADATGAARESVGRLLRRLRDESLIALTSDQVLIGDLDRLMKDVRGI